MCSTVKLFHERIDPSKFNPNTILHPVIVAAPSEPSAITFAMSIPVSSKHFQFGCQSVCSFINNVIITNKTLLSVEHQQPLSTQSICLFWRCQLCHNRKRIKLTVCSIFGNICRHIVIDGSQITISCFPREITRA